MANLLAESTSYQMKSDFLSVSSTRAVARRNNRGRKAYVMKSVKNGLEIRLESQDEMIFAKMLDLDPRGTQVRAQSETFDLVTGVIYQALPAAKHRDSRYYTPDLIDHVGSIKRIFEVKPLRFTKVHDELFVAIEEFCARKGFQFRVLSKEAFSPTLLANIALLHQYARQCSAWLSVWAEAVDQLECKQGLVADVLAGLEPVHHHAMGAILCGVLKTDLKNHSLYALDYPVEPVNGSLSALEILAYA